MAGDTLDSPAFSGIAFKEQPKIDTRSAHNAAYRIRSSDRDFLLQCMSPLMAQSGHPNRACRCPLLGVKRTS
jgi:hypothetical protein